jgi:hypothetical protein
MQAALDSMPVMHIIHHRLKKGSRFSPGILSVFFLSPGIFISRGEQRIELLDRYLEECIKDEKNELCLRIRQVQRQLLQKIWMHKNPVRPETGPVTMLLRIFRPSFLVPVYEVECDFADDPVTVFQSLQMKKEKDFVRPMILKPDDPDLPMLVYSSFPFPVEQICITRFTRRIERLGVLRPSGTCRQFIQSFTGHGMVILAPAGFMKKYGIDLVSTDIEVSMSVPY